MAFVAKNRQDRWLSGLASPKRRSQTVDRLHNGVDFRDELMTEFAGSADELVAALQRRGAEPIAHVIGGPLDGEDVALSDAVAAAVQGYGGVLLVCIAGRLAVYFPEAPSKPFLLVTGA
jgi:hypothetical protein